MEGLLIPRPGFFLLAACMALTAAAVVYLAIRNLIGSHAADRGQGTVSSDSTNSDAKAYAAVLLFALLQSLYFVLRFQAQWAETDSATLTQAIEAMKRQGVIFTDRWFYQHGFGYQALVLALHDWTALSIPVLQSRVLPVVAAVIFSSCAFVFFRQATRRAWAAALGSMFLLLQPDILFVIFRGSHEKIVWPMMMLALTFLYGSIGQPVRRLIGFVAGFYLAVFTIIVTNVFFGSVFLLALGLSLLLGLLFTRRVGKGNPLPRTDLVRLSYICLSGGVLVIINLFYLYPPALSIIRNSQSVLEQLGLLLLSFEPAAQPYDYISIGWINIQTYFALTAFTWLLLAVSGIEWLRRGRLILTGREKPGLMENLDWFLYAGFGFQMLISVPVDFSGALAANLQLRIVPGFSILAAVLVVRGLQQVFPALDQRRTGRIWVLAAGSLCAVWFAAAASMKSTNEPALSNKWGFYSASEWAAVEWTDSRLRSARIWTGIDERLASMFRMWLAADSDSQNLYLFGAYQPSNRFILLTDIDRARTRRMEDELLPVDRWDRVYDNGEAQLYRMPFYILGEP